MINNFNSAGLFSASLGSTNVPIVDPPSELFRRLLQSILLLLLSLISIKNVAFPLMELGRC
ncbi:hypothetical protein BH18THE1_BH18THE1_21340 [soil metagenome]